MDVVAKEMWSKSILFPLVMLYVSNVILTYHKYKSNMKVYSHI